MSSHGHLTPAGLSSFFLSCATVEELVRGDRRRAPDTVAAIGRSWGDSFCLAMGTLPRGRYETVPYMMAPQARIPDVLLTSLGVTQTPRVRALAIQAAPGVLAVLR